MPIRRELRKFYSGEVWQAARRVVLERTGGMFDAAGKYLGGARCEQCGRPDRRRVESRYLKTNGTPRMWWRGAGWGWHNCQGASEIPPRHYEREQFLLVVIQVSHANHEAGDDRPANLKAYCGWCHLNYDQIQHHDTRCGNKDRARQIVAMGALEIR